MRAAWWPASSPRYPPRWRLAYMAAPAPWITLYRNDTKSFVVLVV